MRRKLHERAVEREAMKVEDCNGSLGRYCVCGGLHRTSIARCLCQGLRECWLAVGHNSRSLLLANYFIEIT